MSLDVDLTRKFHISYDNGITWEEREESVYQSNITHNLGLMADKAGIYEALWRPEEINIYKAKDIIELLETGLADLKLRSDYFKSFNPENGWGNYKVLISFVEDYIQACKEYPDSIIEICR